MAIIPVHAKIVTNRKDDTSVAGSTIDGIEVIIDPTVDNVTEQIHPQHNEPEPILENVQVTEVANAIEDALRRNKEDNLSPPSKLITSLWKYNFNCVHQSNIYISKNQLRKQTFLNKTIISTSLIPNKSFSSA